MGYRSSLKKFKSKSIAPSDSDTMFYIDEITYQNNRHINGKPLNNCPETFHQLIKIFLIIGQVFAVMPVSGITSKSANSLRFKLIEVRLFYSILVILTSFVMAIINLCWMVKTEIKFDNMGPFIWFSSNTFVMCEFVRFAYKWPHLMQMWEKIEQTNSIFNLNCHQKAKRLVLTASILMPLLSLIEHLLSIAKGMYVAGICHDYKGVEAFFRQAFPAYYSLFSYSVLSGVILQLLNLYCTFIWNFTDNFIIILSLGLTVQFEHFNAYFNQFKGKALPDTFWGDQRKYYNKLLNLLKETDKSIALIILVSFSNNLYYICLQLFHSVTPSISLVWSIYFWFSLMFLIGRTILVSLSCARINDESKRPLLVLRTVPTSVYREEAKRFLEQVTNTLIALSGMNFFHITRKFMLNVAGTVVTYELVLIQLQREPEAPIDPCSR